MSDGLRDDPSTGFISQRETIRDLKQRLEETKRLHLEAIEMLHEAYFFQPRLEAAERGLRDAADGIILFRTTIERLVAAGDALAGEIMPRIDSPHGPYFIRCGLCGIVIEANFDGDVIKRDHGTGCKVAAWREEREGK